MIAILKTCAQRSSARRSIRHKACARHKIPPRQPDAPPRQKRIRAGSAAEAALVEKYVPLVKNVVGRLAMTLPPHVDGEDLYSAGLTGLLSAVRQDSPSSGTSC